MYKQVLDPVSGSLGWSSLLAVLPLLTLFLLLGGLRMKAVTASLISLAVAIIVAIAVYSMPFGQSMDAAAEGAASADADKARQACGMERASWPRPAVSGPSGIGCQQARQVLPS